jgi:arylsulfatase A-like enzyme
MKFSSTTPPARTALAGLALGTSLLLGATLTACATPSAAISSQAPSGSSAEAQGQPNIMMVLLDDLGYSDLGAYGGEAETPNIDALTQESTQFTDFHAYPLCAPTRAALMTGQDPHQVGLGSMEVLTPPGVPQTTPGYKGSLEGEFTGIAELLGESGYDTYQVGKWHLGGEEGQTPQDLGFDENFTLYDGGASYFADAHRLSPRAVEPTDTVIYERNGQRVDQLPEDFFATRSYTDEMLQMVDKSVEADTPFFSYLAYTAPHDPLHVENKELIDHYLEIYLDDYHYHELRDQRIQRMVELGLLDGENPTRWPEQTPEWDSLNEEKRTDLAYRMAVYAAAIHEADEQIGRVIDHLKDTGEYDNTLIVVASDNGAANSSHHLYIPPGGQGWHTSTYPLMGDVESYGHEGSFPSMGLPNAQVSSGPFFHAKNTLFEGGTRVPAIVKTPAAEGNSEHRVVETFATIADLYPTFADYAGADLASPGTLLGDSARPLLEGTSEAIGDDDFGWEHFGSRSYRSGDWKLIFAPQPMGGTGGYALYNLAEDPGETRDLATEHPDILEDLSRKWEQYARNNGVVVVDFEAVNEAAPASAARSFSIDWASEITTPETATNG